MSKLVKIVKATAKATALLSLSALLSVNWIAGAEPQLMRVDRALITRTSFRDYMASAKSQGYESVPDKLFVSTVYPGARLGAYLHNEFFADEKKSE